jgi:GT2 family glycosyltransferase
LDAVTVTYNSGRTLRNLLSCAPLREAFEQIIVVDAGSTDGSLAMAAELGAITLRPPSPSGYGACVNAGVPLTRGDVFAILNPDILLADASVPALLARALVDERVAVVAPSLKLPDGSVQDSARAFPTPIDLLARRRSARRYGAIRRSGRVPWVVGAFMVVRREAFDLVGGFDESYFLYFEDTDLCWRLKQAGFDTVIDRTVEAHHDHQAASRSPLWHRTTRAHMKSALRFYRRNPRFLLSRGPS